MSVAGSSPVIPTILPDGLVDLSNLISSMTDFDYLRKYCFNYKGNNMFRKVKNSVQGAANQANNTAHKAGLLLDKLNLWMDRAEKNGYIEVEIDVFDFPVVTDVIDFIKDKLGIDTETEDNVVKVKIKLK